MKKLLPTLLRLTMLTARLTKLTARLTMLTMLAAIHSLQGMAQPVMNGGEYEYRLQYSSGINALQNRQYAETAVVGKTLIELNEKKPEGYLLLGNVHFQEELYLQANYNYKKAHLYRANFIFETDRLTLYEQMAASYAKLNNKSQQLEILKEATEYFKGEYPPKLQKQIGRAFFALALLQRERGGSNLVLAKLNLTQAALHNYLPKTSHLILAHYYATTTTEELADLNLAHYKKEIKTENRAASFNFYYKLYNSHIGSQEDEQYLKKDDMLRIKKEVLLYQQSLLRNNAPPSQAINTLRSEIDIYERTLKNDRSETISNTQNNNDNSTKEVEVPSLENSFPNATEKETPKTPLPPPPNQ